MEAIFNQERVMSPEAMRVRVLSDARRVFTNGTVSEAELEHCVDTAVAGLWTERTRVTTFIPVLALREVRSLLEERQAVSSSAV